MGSRGTVGRPGSRPAHDIVIPFGFLFFAAFVFFSIWSWISIGAAEAWRGETCAPNAPLTASCRYVGTATVTTTFAHLAQETNGANVYGVTYTGHGRIPDYSVTYTWGSTPHGMVPLPKKGQVIDVTTWQGTPVYLNFSGLTATVSTPPDRDTFLVAGFMDVAALGAVCSALIGRPLPYTRQALVALRVIDWIWLPLLISGLILVAVHAYELGLLAIEAGGGIAFFVSQALRVRLAIRTRAGHTFVRDDPASPPPPGAQAERERRQQRGHDCPLSGSEQRWVELELTTLTAKLGIHRTSHPVIVPHSGFYPMDYGLTDSVVVDELTRKLCALMKVDFESLSVRLIDGPTSRTRDAVPGEPYPGHFSAQTYDPKLSRYVIELDRDLAVNPPLLTAVIAHEIAHVRLRAYQDRISGGYRVEQRADLLVIAYGLGLFGGNVRFKQHPELPDDRSTSLGGLSPQMYGYALACAAWLREDHAPSWVDALDSPVNKQLKRSLRYLTEHAGGGGLPTMTTPQV
jgi:hypothetical protein